jgi:hypothetical protein
VRQPADQPAVSTVDLRAHGAWPLGQRFSYRLEVATGTLQRRHAPTLAGEPPCSGLVGRYRGGNVVAIYVADGRVWLQHGTRRFDLTDRRTRVVPGDRGVLVRRCAVIRNHSELASIRVRLPLDTLLSYGDDLDQQLDDLLYDLSQTPGFVAWALATWSETPPKRQGAVGESGAAGTQGAWLTGRPGVVLRLVVAPVWGFVKILVVAGVAFGAVFGVAGGVVVGLLDRSVQAGVGGGVQVLLLAGGLFGGLLGLILAGLHLTAVSRLARATGQVPLGTRYRQVVELPLSHQEAFDRCLAAVRALPGAEVERNQPATGRIRARTSNSELGSGQLVTCTLRRTPAGCTVTVASRPRVWTTLVDYGASLTTVQAVLQQLRHGAPRHG